MLIKRKKNMFRKYRKRNITVIIFCILIALLLFLRYRNRKEFYSKNHSMTFSHCDTENQQLYERFKDTYEKSNEGTSFEVMAFKKDEFSSLISEKKRLPDIFAITEDMDFRQLIQDKKLMDLSKFMALAGADGCGALQTGEKNGKTWAIPLTYRMPVIFYSTELFDRYNLAAPENISDFVRLCSVLKLNDAFSFAMSLDESGRWDAADFAEGVLMNSADGGLFTANGDLNSGFYDLLGLSAEMEDKIPAKAKSPDSRISLLKGFANGKYAMIPGTTDDIELLEKYDGFKFGFFIMPGACGNHKAAVKSNMMLGISRKTKFGKEAENFASYMLSEQAQEELASELKELPVRKNLSLEDEILNKAYYISGTVQQQPSLLESISHEEKSICLDMLDAMFSGEAADPDVFIADWAKRLKKDLSRQ